MVLRVPFFNQLGRKEEDTVLTDGNPAETAADDLANSKYDLKSDRKGNLTITDLGDR